MTKNEIRRIFRAKREALTEKEILIYQDLLLIRFQQLPLPPLQIIHTYLPLHFKKEIDPANIVKWLKFMNPGLITALPVADFSNGSMRHFVYDENTRLTENALGINEPADGEELEAKDFDLILLPLLGFDQRGHRVGYGKGFYDRFLDQCRPEALRIGLSFFDPVHLIEDTNTEDRLMDYCITPERIYEF